MEGEGLAELKLRLKTAKSAFTRHTNSLKNHLDRWRDTSIDQDLERVIKESLVGCRADCEQIMRIYDLVEISEELTEQLFSLSFKPKVAETDKRMEDIELLTSQMMARCHDARE